MLSDLLHVLLGAALVAIGVLASAIADRIRGVKLSREVAPRAPRQGRQTTAEPIRVVEATELLRAEPGRGADKRTRLPRIEKTPDGAEDVIAALVAAGYKKPVATDAAWSCTQDERATVEDWTRAALRRCVRGGAS